MSKVTWYGEIYIASIVIHVPWPTGVQFDNTLGGDIDKIDKMVTWES